MRERHLDVLDRVAAQRAEQRQLGERERCAAVGAEVRREVGPQLDLATPAGRDESSTALRLEQRDAPGTNRARDDARVDRVEHRGEVLLLALATRISSRARRAQSAVRYVSRRCERLSIRAAARAPRSRRSPRRSFRTWAVASSMPSILITPIRCSRILSGSAQLRRAGELAREHARSSNERVSSTGRPVSNARRTIVVDLLDDASRRTRPRERRVLESA